MKRIHSMRPGAELSFTPPPDIDVSGLIGGTMNGSVGCGVMVQGKIDGIDDGGEGVRVNAIVETVTFDWWHHMVTDQPLVLCSETYEDLEGGLPSVSMWARRQFEWGE